MVGAERSPECEVAFDRIKQVERGYNGGDSCNLQHERVESDTSLVDVGKHEHSNHADNADDCEAESKGGKRTRPQ